MSEQPRTGEEVHDATVAMIVGAVAAATSTTNLQVGQAGLFLADGVGSALGDGLAEPVRPGAADAPAT